MPPMLREDVGHVEMGTDELVEDGSSRNSLACVMEVQHVVSFMEACIGLQPRNQ